MVYPGSQVQWVVPWICVQREGWPCGALASAGREVAAAAAGEEPADVFIMAMKTEEEEVGVPLSCLANYSAFKQQQQQQQMEKRLMESVCCYCCG